MKKLYRKGTVHPSPPFISDQLAFLPATILTLTAVLSLEDREVLAYLLSCSDGSSGNFCGHRKNNTQKTTPSGGGKGGAGDHTTSFNCSCFRCYMSYWVRWDSSPNRQVIHEIIDAFEDGLVQSKSMKNKKERRKKGFNGSGDFKPSDKLSSGRDELGESESVVETSRGGGGEEEVRGGDGEGGLEKGSVRKLVSFIGERIWSVWN